MKKKYLFLSIFHIATFGTLYLTEINDCNCKNEFKVHSAESMSYSNQDKENIMVNECEESIYNNDLLSNQLLENMRIFSEKVELPFVIVICSYNNARWVKKNLDSVFNQEYQNFRVIYIDDASQDGTANVVTTYIQEHNLQHKVTLIKNAHRCLKLHNIYNAFHGCQDYEILVQLDGDDWLAHTNVLQLLNNIFRNTTTWFSYGQFKRTSGQIGPCCELSKRVKEKALFRQKPWVTSHLKAFYVWLFKMVKLQDLIVNDVNGWQGYYYPVANDCATIFPMLDMARERVRFNPEVVYIFNMINPISAHNSQLSLQEACAREVRQLPVYHRLRQPVLNRLRHFQHEKADCLLISRKSDSTAQALTSLQDFLKNIGTITVLYEAYTEDDISSYQTLKEQFESIHFYDVSTYSIQEILKSLQSNYILCMHDGIVLSAPVYCNQWIIELERTFAHACYGAITAADFKKHAISCQHVEGNLYTWKFLCDKKGIINPSNFGLSLYKKQDVINAFMYEKCATINDIVKTWSCTKVNNQKVGLFFDEPNH